MQDGKERRGIVLDWYPRNSAKVMAQCANLCALGYGLYNLMTDYYLVNGGPLPLQKIEKNCQKKSQNEKIYAICRVKKRKEKIIVNEILETYFIKKDDGYYCDMLDDIMEQQSAKHLRRSRAGAQGGRGNKKDDWPKSVKDIVDKIPKDTKQCFVQNTKQCPSNKEKEKNKNKDISNDISKKTKAKKDCDKFDQQVEELWEIYPSVNRNKGSKRRFTEELQRKLNEGASYDEIKKGVTSYYWYCIQRSQSNKDAHRWIRDGDWCDDYSVSVETDKIPSVHNRHQKPGSFTEILDAAEAAKEIVQRRDADSRGQIIQFDQAQAGT